MRIAAAALALMLAALPVAAQEEPESDLREGLGLVEQGARMLLRGLLSEMGPVLDDMGRAFSEMQPALRDLAAMIGDMRNYEAPLRLPNGDILIRRKPDAERLPGEGEIDL